MKRLFLALPALLAACGTPQEQCIYAGTRDLRTVEELIATTQGNLDRGYAIASETRYVPVFRPCLPPPALPVAGQPPPPPPQMQLCEDVEPQTVEKPVAIDLEAEARKLRQLQTKRKELQRAAEQVIAACRAEHPE